MELDKLQTKALTLTLTGSLNGFHKQESLKYLGAS